MKDLILKSRIRNCLENMISIMKRCTQRAKMVFIMKISEDEDLILKTRIRISLKNVISNFQL